MECLSWVETGDPQAAGTDDRGREDAVAEEVGVGRTTVGHDFGGVATGGGAA